VGGEPPLQEEHGGRDERAVTVRGDSVAQLLGEQWHTDGDGIYRLVEQMDPVEPSPNGPQRGGRRDAVDDLIAELTADLRRP
jgi:hypothetical protein